MYYKTQKAFTMIELVYVIVMIGILSAIAIPKFSETANVAYDSKAKSQFTAVMAAMSTERQKRILQGKTATTDNISDLGDSTYVFNTFDGGTTKVVSIPVKKCVGTNKGCWVRGGSNGARTFTYKFSGSSDTAVFKIDKNRLVCNGTTTALINQCERLLY